jgi:hypothetical protein
LPLKQYGSADQYEKKLEKVMERLGVQDFNYNWDRHGCWVDFHYKGQLYRFEHSVDKAKARGIALKYGSDAFAQVVLSLEDIARMVERGIYDLQSWVEGMKFLPPVIEIPTFLQFMGFSTIPASADDVKERYRTLAKQMHPDVGGNADDFKKLQTASEQALKYFDKR